MGWLEDRRWSDRFLPEIKRILGEYLITAAATTEDALHNTDLIVLKLDAIRIACRVRRPQYYPRYQDEFTLRSSRPNGAKTELTKVVEGWGDYFFYGFSDREEKHLCSWHLCDLKVFRLWFNTCLWHKRHPWETRENDDNSSCFCAFRFSQFPPGFVIATHDAALKVTP